MSCSSIWAAVAARRTHRSPPGSFAICWAASPLATAVNVHFAASTPNFLVLEYRAPVEDAYKDVLKEPIMVQDGYVPIPNKPGWGVELNEEAFQYYPPTRWKRSTGFHDDGSIAFI